MKPDLYRVTLPAVQLSASNAGAVIDWIENTGGTAEPYGRDAIVVHGMIITFGDGVALLGGTFVRVSKEEFAGAELVTEDPTRKAE